MSATMLSVMLETDAVAFDFKRLTAQLAARLCTALLDFALSPVEDVSHSGPCPVGWPGSYWMSQKKKVLQDREDVRRSFEALAAARKDMELIAKEIERARLRNVYRGTPFPIGFAEAVQLHASANNSEAIYRACLYRA